MSKIFIIYDFSTSNPWLLANLNAAHDNLLQCNTIIAPPDSAIAQSIPTPVQFWKIHDTLLPYPPTLEKGWATVINAIEQDHNVLFFTVTLACIAHEYFYTQLAKNINLTENETKVLFLIDNPFLLLEQWLQRQANRKNFKDQLTYLDRILQIPDDIALAQKTFGKHNVQIFNIPRQEISRNPDPALIKKVFAFLGCNSPEKIMRPLEKGLFKSEITRRLYDALEVRENSWPSISKEDIERAIFGLDEQLPEDWLTPEDMRKKLAAAEKDFVNRINMLLPEGNQKFSAFSCITNNHFHEHRPVARKDLASFCNLLGSDACNVLEKRLTNDIHLLTDDQKDLLAFLQQEKGYAHIGEPEQPVELTVLTMTYNHEKFIAECMDSVLSQETNFPVRHIVLDHHSDDGTPSIIAEYASRHKSIRPVLLSQRRYSENVRGLFLRCRTKYAALCDGDDFFSETTKLQEQVDFLEQNPDFSICFHPVAARFDDGRPPMVFPPLNSLPLRRNRTFYLADLMDHNFIQTNSVVYRWRFRDGLPDWFRADLCPGDWYWHMLHAEKGKIGFIPKIMSVYRRHENALYRSALENHVEQRRKMGRAELAAYKAYNEHFRGRYIRPLSLLAGAVFQDFLILDLQNGTNFMTWAMENFPEFRPSFLQVIKDVNEAVAEDKQL